MTRRQTIIELLRQGPISPQNIANKLGITMKELMEEMPHVKKTLHPIKIKVIPAFCKKCGFVFKERSRLKPPTKCPSCRSEWIEKGKFSLDQ